MIKTSHESGYPRMSAKVDSGLIQENEGRIRSIARTLSNEGVPVDDLLQVGRMALLEAAATWQAINNASFWTYARPGVFGAMCDFVTRENRHFKNREDQYSVTHAEDDDPAELREAIAADDFSPEESAAIREVLGRLTQEERDVLKSLLVEGFSGRELAEQRGTSRGAVARVKAAAAKKVAA